MFSVCILVLLSALGVKRFSSSARQWCKWPSSSILPTHRWLPWRLCQSSLASPLACVAAICHLVSWLCCSSPLFHSLPAARLVNGASLFLVNCNSGTPHPSLSLQNKKEFPYSLLSRSACSIDVISYSSVLQFCTYWFGKRVSDLFFTVYMYLQVLACCAL